MRKRKFTRQICFAVQDDIFDLIHEMTQREEVSVSSWIRDAINLKLSQNYQHKNLEEE